jgi:GNAT superfamily N-acetyltransferase
MRIPALPSEEPSPLSIRVARFEDVAAILRLIERALAQGCRDVYDERQRRAVFLGYASSMFIDALGPFETAVAMMGEQLVGAAQIDPRSGLLRALFVDGPLQGQGLGRPLLEHAEARVRAAGFARMSGAMSLNAVAFYRRSGFRARGRVQHVLVGSIFVPVLWMEKALLPA